MSNRNREYIEFLKQRFDEIKFIEFISDLLNLSPNDINSSMSELKPEQKQFRDIVDYYKFIANYSANSDNIGTFIVKLTSEGSQNARTAQRTFISTLLNKYELDAALVAFYQDNEPLWRLSFVKKELSFTDKGIKVDLTPAKRYSYLVGENESVHTAQEQLFSLLNIDTHKITLAEIEKVFDVEKVTKEFFEKYKEKYLVLKEFLDRNEDFITESTNCDFTSEEFAKKLMGQIVFLYFLQKKGLLGVQLVPDELSEEEYIEISGKVDSVCNNLLERYYLKEENKYKINKQALKNESIKDNINNFVSIFKETKYDKAWGTGDKQFVRNMFKKSKLDHKYNFFDDYLEPFFYSGLNERRENQYFILFNCKIPFLNGGLFEPLNNYRWSSAQFNIPDEMFSNGKDGILDIFDLYNFTIDEEEPLEKDIAVDPEMLGKIFENLLEIGDRKDKGAFYTPREIVHHMCQESLAYYISSKVGVNLDEINEFIKYGDVLSQYDWELLLNDSSDFAIGKSVLENLIKIDSALINVKIADPAVGSGAFPLGMLNEIVKLRNNIQTYILIEKELGKISLDELYLTEHLETDIYKMKLQIIENCIYAVDIEPSAIDIAKLRLWLSLVVDYPCDNEPRPLPNLDCKIMQGNSLVDEFENVPLFSPKMLSNNLKNYNRNESKISSVNDIQIQQTLFEDTNKIDEYINIMMNLQKEYFITSDNHIKKELKDKIDRIQIGLVEESIRNDSNKLERFRKISKKRQKPWFVWRLEFYDVFKNNGGFDIVIGNPPYGAKLSEYEKQLFRKKYPDIQFKIDSYAIFILKCMELSNGGVTSLIIPNTLLNNYFLEKVRINLIKNTTINFLINFDSSVFDAVVHSLIIQFENRKNIDNYVKMIWNLNDTSSLINQKMFLNNENSSFIFENTNNSFYNKINKNTKRLDEVIDLRQTIKSGDDTKYIVSAKIADNYKKILRGKDIQRYKKQNPNLYINYGNHLACPRDYRIFEQPHILIRESGKRITATYDDENYYIMSSLYCGIPIDSNYSLKYILALLNSDLFQYLMFKINFENTGGAFTKAKIYHYNQLPVKIISSDAQIKIIDMVDRLLDNYDEKIDKELNDLIFELYEINYEEKQMIESAI